MNQPQGHFSTSNSCPTVTHKVKHKERPTNPVMTTGTNKVPALLQQMQSLEQQEVLPQLSLLERVSSPPQSCNPSKTLLSHLGEEISARPRPYQNLSQPYQSVTTQQTIPAKNQRSSNILLPSIHSSDHILNWIDIGESSTLDSIPIKTPPITKRLNGSSLTSLPLPKEEIQLKKRKRTRSVVMEEDYQTRNVDYTRVTCRGSRKNQLQDSPLIPAVKQLVRSLAPLAQILPTLSGPSNLHSLPQQDSLHQNGITSSRGSLSTSTTSSHPSTMSHLLRRTLDAWDLLKSALDTPNPQDESGPMATGSQHIMRSSKQPRLFSPTGNKNSEITANTSTVNSHRKLSRPTGESSSMMPQSEMKLGRDNKCYSPIGINSLSYTQPLSCLMESSPKNRRLPPPMGTNPNSISVDDSTPQMGALMDPTVATNTTVANVSGKAIAKSLATARAEGI